MPAQHAPPSAVRVIPCGALDDDPGGRETLHIMVGSKAAFEVVAGGPQFVAYPARDFPSIARVARGVQ